MRVCDLLAVQMTLRIASNKSGLYSDRIAQHERNLIICLNRLTIQMIWVEWVMGFADINGGPVYLVQHTKCLVPHQLLHYTTLDLSTPFAISKTGWRPSKAEAIEHECLALMRAIGVLRELSFSMFCLCYKTV